MELKITQMSYTELETAQIVTNGRPAEIRTRNPRSSSVQHEQSSKGHLGQSKELRQSCLNEAPSDVITWLDGSTYLR